MSSQIKRASAQVFTTKSPSRGRGCSTNLITLKTPSSVLKILGHHLFTSSTWRVFKPRRPLRVNYRSELCGEQHTKQRALVDEICKESNAAWWCHTVKLKSTNDSVAVAAHIQNRVVLITRVQAATTTAKKGKAKLAARQKNNHQQQSAIEIVRHSPMSRI